jgi:hypothetical protein
MQTEQIKTLVEGGHYKPDPARVAIAMLQRRGVRELLTAEDPSVNRVGRTPRPPELPRQAA